MDSSRLSHSHESLGRRSVNHAAYQKGGEDGYDAEGSLVLSYEGFLSFWDEAGVKDVMGEVSKMMAALQETSYNPVCLCN